MHRACGVTPIDEVGWSLKETLMFLFLRVESSTEGMESRGTQPSAGAPRGGYCRPCLCILSLLLFDPWWFFSDFPDVSTKTQTSAS